MLTLAGLLKERNDATPSPRAHMVPCHYCEGDASFLVSSSDRNRHTTELNFEYFQCGQCGLVFLDPIPDDLRPFYKGGYDQIPQNITELREIAEKALYRMKPILRYKSSGSLIEIGPWIGAFGSNAKDAGFKVTAIEMDQTCVDFLNTTVGIRALQSSDPATTLESINEQFDVIALWHSLEHLLRPWDVLEQAAKKLAPGGILLVAIPNIESYEFSVLEGAWANLDAPRHLYFFPMRSLIALCGSFNLAVLEISTTDELSDAFSLGTWRSIAHSIVPIRYVRGALAIGLKYLANLKERRTGSGPGITAVFQRPF